MKSPLGPGIPPSRPGAGHVLLQAPPEGLPHVHADGPDGPLALTFSGSQGKVIRKAP